MIDVEFYKPDVARMENKYRKVDDLLYFRDKELGSSGVKLM